MTVDLRGKKDLPSETASAAELLARLIAFDSTSSKSNIGLIEFIRDYLAGHGIGSALIPSPDGEKAGLFATIGPSRDGGIGLSAHSDCVPVEGQTWTADPFALRESDGRLIGRGTCDMKGFIACVLASVPRFAGRTLSRPVHIIISYDEEIGCIGVRPLIARLGYDLPRPAAIIVGEPSDMRVIDTHKRIDSFRTIVTGREAHSSVPALGVNAISAAAEMVRELDRLGAEVASRHRDPRFDPPCSTVMVGIIRGGTAGNIVPKTCTFNWQVRSLPNAPPAEVPRDLAAFVEARLLPRMQQVAEDANIETIAHNSVPAFVAAPESPAVALAQKLTGANDTYAVSYGTEAGLFEHAGCPAVICGPGSVAQAHAADEFVSLDQMESCMKFLARLADEASA